MNDFRSKYEKRDKDIIDYNCTDFLIGDELIRIREPVPENIVKGGYSVCIGAAQTFGPFVEKPYPLLLSKLLNFPVVNLGRGGTSALFFSRENYLSFINKGSFVVIQIMAARGVENSSFRPTNRGGQNNVVLKETGQIVKSKAYYRKLITSSDTDLIKQNILESRENWIKNYQVLLNSIHVPKILFWFSQRAPDYQEKFTKLRKLYSKYPQLVNESMVNTIKPFADEYLEFISKKGLPQKIISKEGGIPKLYRNGEVIIKKVNKYYPSPEMHEEAAQELFRICAKYSPER